MRIVFLFTHKQALFCFSPFKIERFNQVYLQLWQKPYGGCSLLKNFKWSKPIWSYIFTVITLFNHANILGKNPATWNDREINFLFDMTRGKFSYFRNEEAAEKSWKRASFIPKRERANHFEKNGFPPVTFNGKLLFGCTLYGTWQIVYYFQQEL